MKTFFTTTDRIALERYRALAYYKKQRVWGRKPKRKLFQRDNLIFAGINISNQK
jgi:hypothetical protein